MAKAGCKFTVRFETSSSTTSFRVNPQTPDRISPNAHVCTNKLTQLASETTCRSFSPDFFFWVRFPVVTAVLTDVLPVAVAVQSVHYKGVCPYPAHLFIDVLAKVGHVKNAATIVQTRINQVFPQAFEQRERDLSLVHVHNSSTANGIFDNDMVLFLENLNLCNCEHRGGLDRF